MTEKKTEKLVVYNIQEEGKEKDPYWFKIGVAFVNKDDSINVYLNALPIDGKLHIRKPKDENSK